MVSLYCHQILMVLRIARFTVVITTAPARASELLVLQRRYESMQAASEALRTAATATARRWSAAVVVLFGAVVVLAVVLIPGGHPGPVRWPVAGLMAIGATLPLRLLLWITRPQPEP